MAERLFSTTFQLWESQDDALNKIVSDKTNETKGRQKVSRSTVMREAFDEYLENHYPNLLKTK